jgi:hypothetical protein
MRWSRLISLRRAEQVRDPKPYGSPPAGATPVVP